MTKTMRPILAAAALALLPSLAPAGERILLVKTTEDPRFPADPQVCARAGFTPVNVVLGASVWSLETRASRGEVVNETVRRLGTATGCGRLTSIVPFTAGQLFLIQFDLEEGAYVATGTCDIVSFTVPAAGILLAGCALRIVSGPPGVVGGIATSASVFNPQSIPGFGTGSVWTLHVYTAEP
jgi:hypothetical protein